MDLSERLPSHTQYYLNLEQLKCLVGDDLSEPPQELIEMLRRLLSETSSTFQKLHNSWDVIPEVERQKKIHGVRGTIVNFGLSKVGELLEEVELNPSQLNNDEVKATFFEAISAFNVSVDLLKTIFPQV